MAIYRAQFKPSGQLDRPYVMLGINVIAADTDAGAKYLFTSQQQAFVNIRTGRPGRLPPPVDDFESRLDPAGHAVLSQALSCSVVGSPETVKRGLAEFARRTGADELMVTGQIFDHQARLRSFEIIAEVHKELASAA
jgi:alkanesulfonate monooxygenase SsuD/methylene tetrahydromethanopterin reductase-like flavin-dependent oxidoreductase (luciferase family)